MSHIRKEFKSIVDNIDDTVTRVIGLKGDSAIRAVWTSPVTTRSNPIIGVNTSKPTESVISLDAQFQTTQALSEATKPKVE